MNLRKEKWHGQLVLSGVGSPTNHSGSVMSIVAESLKDLAKLNPRTMADGEQEIVIRIRTKPFGESKSDSDLLRASEIAGELVESNTSGGPNEGESERQFALRLVEEGTAEAVAMVIAQEWFREERIK